MTLIRTAIAAITLFVPVSAFAAADGTVSSPARPAVEQVLSTQRTDSTVATDPATDPAPDAVRETVPEAEIRARAATPPAAPTKPRVIRPAKLSVVRAVPAPQPALGCSGYWCGRQFVLMLGVGY